ncbi:SdpI family protein [Streptomyces sp. DASNCL29]|uniref:SdpI family protein n=1 Tax=Streptomyces sp. DASNCL29 TaxID=2583819 RepID=UPI00110FF041|nr:SdpI family protein [Streptomyces sp. DASNCL29]TMU89932.1 SdpI family protein [Streptomyces sp. DASNCL29]
MSSGHKTMTGFLTVICGLILAIVGLLMSWPLWVWTIIAVVLLTGSTLTARAIGPSGAPIPPDRMLEPDLPIPEPERWERLVSEVALPSAVPDYDFLFSATIRWCPGDSRADAPYINPGALAVDAVLDRARRITAAQPPHRSSLTQHQLNGALGTMVPDPSGRVKALAEDVTLRLSEADIERLHKLSTVRKDEEVWEHERNYERNKRAYLGEDVFKDTGSAVVWWMAKNDDHVEKAVNLIGPLAQLSSAANNTEIPERFRHLVSGFPPERERERPDSRPSPDDLFYDAPFLTARAFDEASVTDLMERAMDLLGLEEDSDGRAMLGRRIADALRAQGHADIAEEVRRRFDEPPPPPEPDPDLDPDGFGPDSEAAA